MVDVETKYPNLQTARAIVRLPELRDIRGIIEYLETNRAHLTPYEPTWPPDICTESLWQARVARGRADFDKGRAVRCFIFERNGGRPIGTVALSQIFRGPFHACYVGYALARRYQGKGLMQEVLRRVIDYAFDDLALHRIMANYMPFNLRSARLLRKLGFVVEGYARDYLRINGQWEDHVLTSLTNERWASPGSER